MKVDLRAERLNRGLSLNALAAEVGVPKSTLARMETGIAPRPGVRLKVADFYEYAVTDIWPIDDVEAAAA